MRLLRQRLAGAQGLHQGARPEVVGGQRLLRVPAEQVGQVPEIPGRAVGGLLQVVRVGHAVLGGGRRHELERPAGALRADRRRVQAALDQPHRLEQGGVEVVVDRRLVDDRLGVGRGRGGGSGGGGAGPGVEYALDVEGVPQPQAALLLVPRPVLREPALEGGSGEAPVRVLGRLGADHRVLVQRVAVRGLKPGADAGEGLVAVGVDGNLDAVGGERRLAQPGGPAQIGQIEAVTDGEVLDLSPFFRSLRGVEQRSDAVALALYDTLFDLLRRCGVVRMQVAHHRLVDVAQSKPVDRIGVCAAAADRSGSFAYDVAVLVQMLEHRNVDALPVLIRADVVELLDADLRDVGVGDAFLQVLLVDVGIQRADEARVLHDFALVTGDEQAIRSAGEVRTGDGVGRVETFPVLGFESSLTVLFLKGYDVAVSAKKTAEWVAQIVESHYEIPIAALDLVPVPGRITSAFGRIGRDLRKRESGARLRAV